jgi:hypothetical protein
MGRIEELRKTIKEVAEYVKNGIDEGDLRKYYPDFCIQYPTLFKMIIQNGDHSNILDRMLDAAKIVESGESTIEDMDKEVGLELAKKYIYPHIDMTKET